MSLSKVKHYNSEVEEMTNAEKFRKIFKKFATEVWAFPEKDFLTWLNAEYKEPTTKNNVGVDAISRIETIDYLCKHCPDDGECFKDCDEIKHLRELPSVTPQEPKTGHWVFAQRGKCVDVKCSECKNVRVKDYAYNYTVEHILANKENIVELLAEGDMQYCPYCGAKMVEPPESEDTE